MRRSTAPQSDELSANIKPRNTCDFLFIRIVAACYRPLVVVRVRRGRSGIQGLRARS